jgi:signal transduction histidine kinase
MADFFTENFIIVYFFYGLSFFAMGLAVLLEAGRPSELDFAHALRPLAGFGLIHGSHEWIEMFLLIREKTAHIPPTDDWISPARVILLASSFLFLVAFGARLITGPSRPKLLILMLSVVTLIWVTGLIGVYFLQDPSVNRTVAADVYTRYSLAIPGAGLTVWGLLLQRKRFFEQGMYGFGRDVAIAALAFGMYGGIGQLFASPSAIFPSPYLNTEVFIRWFGFPIQVFRAVMAAMSAVFIVRSLRAFEVESNRHLEALEQARRNEQRRLEEIRAELLHRTVKAQENERKRIARELHDETGQTLTALGMGLRGLSESVSTHPQRAVVQAQQLETLALSGITELQRLVTGLHPPQLDDLGLLAALRWYAGDVSQRSDIPINIHGQGPRPHLTSDFRAVIFRIAQEAITNVVRHANASHIDVDLVYTPAEIYLRIEDDGQGFDVEKILRDGADSATCWGLLGMQERALLVGGTCSILSMPGKGTLVEVRVPLPGEGINDTDQIIAR